MYSKPTNRIECDVSFRIMGSDLEPEEITSMLKITPDENHRKGDPNNQLSKKGHHLHYAPYRSGLWSFNSKLSRSSPLDDHLNWVLTQLEPVKTQIKTLSQKGYSLDIYCGYFIIPLSHIGVSLNHELLQRFSELCIDLNLEIYCSE